MMSSAARLSAPLTCSVVQVCVLSGMSLFPFVVAITLHHPGHQSNSATTPTGLAEVGDWATSCVNVIDVTGLRREDLPLLGCPRRSFIGSPTAARPHPG